MNGSHGAHHGKAPCPALGAIGYRPQRLLSSSHSASAFPPASISVRSKLAKSQPWPARILKQPAARRRLLPKKLEPEADREARRIQAFGRQDNTRTAVSTYARHCTILRDAVAFHRRVTPRRIVVGEPHAEPGIHSRAVVGLERRPKQLGVMPKAQDEDDVLQSAYSLTTRGVEA
jgi:hypothetical protein